MGETPVEVPPVEEVKGMTLEEIVARFGAEVAKKIIDLLERKPPTVAYGRPRHIKAVLRWGLERESFTAEEVRDFLRSIDPNVRDERLTYTRVSLLGWNPTLFAKVNGRYRLTPSAREVAAVLSDGDEFSTVDLILLRGMYLSQGTKYGGVMTRVYALFTAAPDAVWTRPRLKEEHKRCFAPLLNPENPEKRSQWEVDQYLPYLEELQLITRLGRGEYRLVMS